MKSTKIAFIGGDKRMFCCAEALYSNGYECALYGFDKISDRADSTRCASLYDCLLNASAVVLPLPASRDGITVSGDSAVIRLCDVFSAVGAEVPIFGGFVSEKVRCIAQNYGHDILDFFEDEELTLNNAYVTAEGAIYLAMRNSEASLWKSKCLVCGYGRIGKYTARLLKSFGAYVTVLARRQETRAQALLDDCDVLDMQSLCGKLGEFDIIFNTIPANIFGEREVAEMSERQLYIELASAPYGLTPRLAQSRNIEIIDGSALPVRYCPESAGGFIAQKIGYELGRLGVV